MDKHDPKKIDDQFRRYVLERDNKGMRDYMRTHLTEEDFQYFLNTFE